MEFEFLSLIVIFGVSLAVINMKFMMHERIRQLKKENDYLRKEIRRLEIDYFGEILVHDEPSSLQTRTKGHLVG